MCKFVQNMATKGKSKAAIGKDPNTSADVFDLRLVITGENAGIARSFLEQKKKSESRRTLTNTVEALIVEAAYAKEIQAPTQQQ